MKVPISVCYYNETYYSKKISYCIFYTHPKYFMTFLRFY